METRKDQDVGDVGNADWPVGWWADIRDVEHSSPLCEHRAELPARRG